MKRVLSLLFPLLVFVALSTPLYAQDLSFTTGEKLSHFLSVCISKQDAIDILNAHKDGGRDAAGKVWEAKDGCQNGNVVGAKVGKVVYAVKIDGGVFSAVEIIWEGEVVGYFMTSSPVNKAQRNS